MITVQELIDKLLEIADKSKEVLKEQGDQDISEVVDGYEYVILKQVTVQQLIDELLKVKDKSKEVVIDNPYFDKVYLEIDEIENFEDCVTIWVKQKYGMENK